MTEDTKGILSMVLAGVAAVALTIAVIVGTTRLCATANIRNLTRTLVLEKGMPVEEARRIAEEVYR